jgi:hypothetical protein
VVIQNEVVLREAETLLEQFTERDVRPFRRLQVVDLQRALDGLGHVMPGGSMEALQRSLATRIEIFRTLFLSFLPNLFRYQTERRTYDTLSLARGTTERLESILQRADRYETIVRDLYEHDNRRAENRLGILVLLLTLVGLVSATADFAQLMSLPEHPWLRGFAVSIVLGVAALAVGIGLAAGRRRRRARSTPRLDRPSSVH